MRVDNYTRAVLTVIALCLVYLCARDTAPSVRAQEAPTRVVITGVALEHGATRNILPVGVVGELRAAGEGFTAVPMLPIQVRVPQPVEIRSERPLKIEAEQPLLVRAVREPGSQRPGPND
jgi:hypothetical protein